MVEYKFMNRKWITVIRMHTCLLEQAQQDFRNLEIRINGKIYTENSPELIDEIKKEKMWKELQNG